MISSEWPPGIMAGILPFGRVTASGLPFSSQWSCSNEQSFPVLSSCISLKQSENYIFILLQAPWCMGVIHQVVEVHPTPGNWSCISTANIIKPWLESEQGLSLHCGSAYGHRQHCVSFHNTYQQRTVPTVNTGIMLMLWYILLNCYVVCLSCKDDRCKMLLVKILIMHGAVEALFWNKYIILIYKIFVVLSIYTVLLCVNIQGQGYWAWKFFFVQHSPQKLRTITKLPNRHLSLISVLGLMFVNCVFDYYVI